MSWSCEADRDFPFNFYFTFYTLAFAIMVSCLLNVFLPNSFDKQLVNEDQQQQRQQQHQEQQQQQHRQQEEEPQSREANDQRWSLNQDLFDAPDHVIVG